MSQTSIPSRPLPRVLLIDDDKLLLHAMATGLRSHGYEVIEARNGAEGIERLRSQAVDLVITDIFMPDGDGFEVMMTLRATYPKLPIVAMSGWPTDQAPYLTAAKKLGARRTLVKPFAVSELAGVAGEVLASA